MLYVVNLVKVDYARCGCGMCTLGVFDTKEKALALMDKVYSEYFMAEMILTFDITMRTEKKPDKYVVYDEKTYMALSLKTVELNQYQY